MAIYQIGETVICSITVKDEDGALQDAATSMNIVIDQTAPDSASKITSTAMTNDSTGLYHYDCQVAGYAAGDYKITYTATDGTRISIQTDTFTLE